MFCENCGEISVDNVCCMNESCNVCGCEKCCDFEGLPVCEWCKPFAKLVFCKSCKSDTIFFHCGSSGSSSSGSSGSSSSSSSNSSSSGISSGSSSGDDISGISSSSSSSKNKRIYVDEDDEEYEKELQAAILLSMKPTNSSDSDLEESFEECYHCNKMLNINGEEVAGDFSGEVLLTSTECRLISQFIELNDEDMDEQLINGRRSGSGIGQNGCNGEWYADDKNNNPELQAAMILSMKVNTSSDIVSSSDSSTVSNSDGRSSSNSGNGSSSSSSSASVSVSASVCNSESSNSGEGSSKRRRVENHREHPSPHK